MHDVYKNIEYNPDKENKILIVLDDMIAKRELPQIAVNHSSDINTKDLVISIENVHMNHILF